LLPLTAAFGLTHICLPFCCEVFACCSPVIGFMGTHPPVVYTGFGFCTWLSVVLPFRHGLQEFRFELQLHF